MTQPKRSDKVALWVTYLNIVLYALCFQLQRPVEPFLVQSLGDEANISKTYGSLQSFFSTIQTFGSPVVGILLDRLGIRKASAMVFLASALSYAILAGATDLLMLFVSKVPTALQHAFLVAQATAATSTGQDAAARAQALGRMTTAYTIGATIGPALGGYLAEKNDLYLGARLAVFGSLLSVVCSLLFLPDAKEITSNRPAIERKRSLLEEIQNSFAIAMRENLWPLLLVKVVGGVSASMHSTALPLVLTQDLNFEPAELGLSMSVAMFSVAAFGAVAMSPLASVLGPPRMTRAGITFRVFMAFFLAFIIGRSSLHKNGLMWPIVAGSVLHALSSHVLATGLTTQTTGAVAKDEQGALLGLEHGLFSLARIVGPTLGTTVLLLRSEGFWAVATSCAVIDVSMVISLEIWSRRMAMKGEPAKVAAHKD